MTGAKQIIQWLERKKTKVSILTNLSSQSIALSLANPATPLEEMYSKLGNRLEIRSNNTLHAKLFLISGKLALFGSSNLTGGGMETNHEINSLADSRKKEGMTTISVLSTWFDNLWSSSINIDPAIKLAVIGEQWKAANKRIKGVLNDLQPVPQLGGNYWEKLEQLCKKPKWQRDALAVLMNEKNENQKNFDNKLIFLKELGVIDYDEKRVTVINKVKNRDHAYRLVSKLLNGIESCLREITVSTGIGYSELAIKLETVIDDKNMITAVNWLEGLGFITRLKGRKHSFSGTKEGKKLLKNIQSNIRLAE